LHFGIKIQHSWPDTLKLFIASEGVPVSIIEPERVFSVTGSFVTKTRARLGEDSSIKMLTRLKCELFFTFELNNRLVQKNLEFVLNLDC
jgi:hypothetical protein